MALTNKQNEALQLMLAGKNVFLSGEAGTGKSYVLREFLAQSKRKTVVCAPTGIAAINVNGSTLHRVFNIPVEPLSPRHRIGGSEVVDEAEIIVIDEISMCRFDVFDFVTKSIRASERKTKSKKQLIVVGDFLQLPPVITGKDREVLENYWGEDQVKDGFAFQTPMWQDFDFHMVVLDEQMRQQGNDDFVTKLNQVRRGNEAALEWFNDQKSSVQKGVYICPTNKKAEEINERETSKLRSRPVKYDAVVTGTVQSSDKPTADQLVLKKGMRVMSLINDSEGHFQNGSLGTIRQTDAFGVYVNFDSGSEVYMEPYQWEVFDYKITPAPEKKVEKITIGTFRQLPLKPAYAITIHKSQGQTYDAVNVIPSCFAPGQLYVALSRCKKIENLHITSPIKPEYLLTSKDVLAFYGYDRLDDFVTKSNAGGQRAGAGRKSKYGTAATKTIRVPISAISEIEKLLESRKWE